jgi:hypothetical protein
MKRKTELGKNWLNDLLDDVERRRGEYVKSRYYVVEITPRKAYWRGDGHGGSDRDWTDTKTIIVSDYFQTKPAAQKFLDEHEPDDGNRLEICQEKLYRRVVEEWF